MRQFVLWCYCVVPYVLLSDESMYRESAINYNVHDAYFLTMLNVAVTVAAYAIHAVLSGSSQMRLLWICMCLLVLRCQTITVMDCMT